MKIVSYDTFSTYLTLPRKDYGVYFNSSTGAYSDLQTFVGAALLFGAGIRHARLMINEHNVHNKYCKTVEKEFANTLAFFCGILY